MKVSKQPLGSFGLLSIVMALAATFLGNLSLRSLADDAALDLGSLNDVGIYLRVDYSGTTFNRRTGEMRTNVLVTNISSQEVNGPLVFLLDSISVGGVSLNSPSGVCDGKPYVDLTSAVGDDGILSPGETSAPRTLSFSNRDRLRFSFEAKCLGVVILSAPPAPTLDSHPTLTAASTITLSGNATQAVTVKVSAPSGVFEVPVSDNRFTANIPLVSNKLNHIFFTSRNAGGVPSAPTAISIINDSSPPNVQIQFPKNGALITTDKTDVAGFVADVFSGFEGLEVIVNGIEAEVDVGIGTNGTFFLPGLELAEGENIISATATDVLGNTITKQISVERINIPANAPKIKVVSGNAQAAPVDAFLADPIVVQVTQGNGSPFANKVVNFKVTKSNGQLSGEVSEEGSLMYQTRTDANGLASAFWRVGSDAGCGNNRVEVTSQDILGTTAFCATATPGSPDQINIGTGSNQRGEAGAPAALPLTAWVSDGCNGVGGIPVTFVVTSGGGEVNGQQTVTVPSTRTGHASVNFTFGPSGGTNRITATYPGNPTNPAVFNLFGLVRDEDNPTTMSGIVLDNGKNPIGNARCVLTVDGVDQPTVFTDAEGKFFLTGIDDGAAHFHVDATEADLLNGKSIPPGSFPALTYELVIVPNAENSLPTPVLLPPLNPANAKPYDGTQDVELTVEEIEGLKMIIKAGSMTLADGTVPSPGDPATLSLNQVHHDDIPMPMPDGAAPPFAWTLQPASATFDPPIEIQYPNMSGLPPGAVAYFLSFNHDSGDFEIVAPGRVIPDGSTIVTDPGTGLSVSGWGCNCPPYSVTGECENCTEECVDNGSLSGGEIDVPKKEVKEGESVMFIVKSIDDSGGEKKKICKDENGNVTSETTESISGVTPTIEWTITKPDGTTVPGTGPTASTAADVCGTYKFSYTATADRDCPPSSLSKSASAMRVLEDFGPDVKIEFPLPSAVENALQKLGTFLGLNDPSVTADVTTKTRDCCDEMNAVIMDGESEGSGNLEISASTKSIPIKVPTPAGIIPLGVVIDEVLSFPIVGAVATIKAEAGLIAKGSVKFTGQGGIRENQCFPDDESLNCVFANVGAGIGISVEATVSAAVCDVEGNDCDGFDVDFAKASAGLSGKIGYDGCKSPPIDIGVSVSGSVSVGLKITISGKTFGPEVSKGFGPYAILP